MGPAKAAVHLRGLGRARGDGVVEEAAVTFIAAVSATIGNGIFSWYRHRYFIPILISSVI